jgi:hypothetical protein
MYPTILSEEKALDVEKRIVALLALHFYRKDTWVNTFENAPWVYIPQNVTQLRRMFTDISSSAFTHVIRSMHKSGVIWLYKHSDKGIPDGICLSWVYLNKDLFGPGKIEVIDAYGRSPRYRSFNQPNFGGAR